MFEREIKFIYDFNLNKVNRLGPYFTFEQLRAIDVHPAILNYISAEIDFLIFEDRQNLLKNSLFDYSGEKISNLFNQIGEEVKKSKRFSLEYVSKLILHSSSFTINYLIRPKWTLVKFVFDENEHKTTTEIKQILNYVYYYGHIKKIIVSYINSKKILSMNSAEFSELLDRVDQLGIESHLPGILSNSLKSMADFFNIGELQKNKIPLAAVVQFLEEKNLTGYISKIHSTFGSDLSQKINIADFQKAFDSVMFEKTELIEEEPPADEIVEIPEEKIGEAMETAEEPAEEIIAEKVPEEEIAPVDSEISPPIEEKEELVEKELTKKEEEFAEKEPIDSTEFGVDDKTTAFENKPETDGEAIGKEAGKEPFKPFKFRINVKENNKIEPVENEIEAHADDQLLDKTAADESIEPSKSFFGEDEIDEEKIESFAELVESEKIEPEEGETVREEMAGEALKMDKFDQDEIPHVEDELDNSNQTADEEIELNEKESMLRSILKVESGEDDEKKEKLQTPRKSLKNVERSQAEKKPAEANGSKKIDLAELLEHKEMTKIIEVIFDYDIEEFSNTIDEITECKSLEDALVVLNQTLKNHNINKNSREAESLRTIISNYFKD